MEFKGNKITWRQIVDAIICITIGTLTGLLVYGLFLYFNIAIFGWNLGLIFAPLSAGYVETKIANRIIGENIGAISAFILFITTTYYSFILKNPLLGLNLITAGATIVILQAAFPTLINFILLIIIGGIVSGFHKTYMKIANRVYNRLKDKNFIKWQGDPPVDAEIPVFDEIKSNEILNNLDFSFYTITDLKKSSYENIGIFQYDIFLDRDTKLIQPDPEKLGKEFILKIKQGKDQCLIRLARQIRKNGGNGIVDLTISYSLIGVNGDHIQITAVGMGISIK